MASKSEDRRPIVREEEIDTFPPEYSNDFEDTIGEEEQPPPPDLVDRYHFVYFSFGLLGIMMLLPFNVILTATNFWMYKFRNPNHTFNPDDNSDRTHMQTYFESNASIYNNLFFLVTLLFNIYFGHLIRPKIRIYFSLFLTFVIFIAITWFAVADTDSYQDTFYSIVIGLVIGLSVASAIFQSTLLGIMSLFPSKYMSLNIIAQAFSGILAAAIQLLTLVKKMDAQRSAFYFFLITDVLIVLTVICLIIVRKTRFYKFYSKMAQNSNSDEVTRQSINGDSISNYHPESDSIILFVLKRNRVYLISVILLFWATLCVYPPLTILITARDPSISPWDGRLFTTVVCFCLFNLADMVGRIVASLVPLSDRKSLYLLMISIFRWSLVPMLMLCNAHPRSHLPVYFVNDSFVVLFVVLLGLTNGYVLMASIANTAQGLAPHMHEANGFVLTLVMGISVVLGSLTSNILLHML